MAARRELLLDTANRLFRHYGFSKTTIADIASAAGVAVGTVYLEFDSKERILEALSVRAHARVLESMQTAAVAKELSERFVRVVEARTRAYLELSNEGQHACELVFCRKPGVESAHARFCEEERALLARLFAEASDTGELGGIDPHRTAALVQNALLFLAPPRLSEVPREEALRLAKDICTLLLEGLVRRRPKR